MSNEKRNQGIFFGVVGVITLVVAVIGATFAYFTATESVDNQITGNAATISFGLNVRKVTTVDDTKGGMIPMTDPMIEPAVSNESEKGACVDDNGNAVCQIYEITVTNDGTAGMYLDGFVNLTGGLRSSDNNSQSGKTTMRWVQVFRTGDSDATATYSVTGSHAIAPSVSHSITFVTSGRSNTNTTLSTTQTQGNYTYGGNTYPAISNNYLRMSKQDAGTATYDRDVDQASTLVINQYIAPKDAAGAEVKLYIAVWLTETGTDQTPLTSGTSDVALNFFGGRVIFNSAQGGEVSATFTGYARVQADTLTA